MKKVDKIVDSIHFRSAAIMDPVMIDRVLRANVVFGSPRCDCAGTGLCKIIGPDDLLSLDEYCSCRFAETKIIWLPEWIVFEFLSDAISPPCYQKHFYDGYFMVQDAFAYQPSGWAESYQIRVEPGCYSTLEDNKHLQLYFERTNKSTSRQKIESYQLANNKIITHKI